MKEEKGVMEQKGLNWVGDGKADRRERMGKDSQQ